MGRQTHTDVNRRLFSARQVLLLGQYSTGKTTFIKFLLGREDGYPGKPRCSCAATASCAASWCRSNCRQNAGQIEQPQKDRPTIALPCGR